MSATVSEIDAYIYEIYSSFAECGAKLAKYQKLGAKELECNKFKFRLLQHFVRIISDYFDSDDYTANNFFTTDEINDVMQHINNILNSNYWVEL